MARLVAARFVTARLTGLGWRLLCAAVVAPAAGYLLGYPVLALLGVGALGALVVSVVTLAAQPGIEIDREVYPDRVGRGEVAVGLVTARNPGRRAVESFVHDQHALRGARRSIFGGELRLPGGGQREFGYPLPTDRRGQAEIGPLHVISTDPLGLLRRVREVGQRRRLWVYPRAHPFELRSAAWSMDRDGGGADTVLEGSVTFHRLRDYMPGDDLRRVHWRSSARRDTLLVRQNVDITRPVVTVALVTDPAGYPDPAMFEEAVDAAASVLVAARDGLVPARLVTGATVLAAAGVGELRDCLDELAAIEPDGTGGLPAVADRLRPLPARGLLVIACGRLTAAELTTAGELAARYAPAVLARFGSTADGYTAGELTMIDATGAAEFCRQWREQRRPYGWLAGS